MNEDEEWEKARARDLAAGEHRHYATAAAPRTRSRAALLRHLDPAHARLNVRCRGRVIARVIDDPMRGLVVALEALAPESATGVVFTTVPLADGNPIMVACRCRDGRHMLDAHRLRACSTTGRASGVANIGVSKVCTDA